MKRYVLALVAVATTMSFASAAVCKPIAGVTWNAPLASSAITFSSAPPSSLQYWSKGVAGNATAPPCSWKHPSVESNLAGKELKVWDVSRYKGLSAKLKWTGTVVTGTPTLTWNLYDANCVFLESPPVAQEPAAGVWRSFKLHSATKWLATFVHGTGAAHTITVTFNTSGKKCPKKKKK